jgi:hypothetical protein
MRFFFPFLKNEPNPEAHEGLELFVACFLAPAARDGKLNAYEEMPLELGFHALGVAALYNDEALRPGIAARLRDVVEAAKGVGYIHPQHEQLRRTYELVCQNGLYYSENDWDHLRKWFVGLQFAVDDAPPAPVAARERRRNRSDADLFGCMVVDLQLDTETDRSPKPPVESRDVVAEGEPDPPTPECAVDPSAYQHVLDGTLQERLTGSSRDIVGSIVKTLRGPWRPLYAFDPHRRGADDMAVQVVEPPSDVWFIGDLHGDLLALECALSHIRSASTGGPKPRIVFLGDLIDDGPLAYCVVLRFMELVKDDPSAVCLLAGNHDEALSYDERSGMFRSSVSPSDFTDFLNERGRDTSLGDAARDAGRAFIDLVRSSPRALFFPDGLLAVHGGIPQSDMWKSNGFESRDSLNAKECLQDFVWTRAHERSLRRIPDRRSRGAEFGIADLSGFCEAAERVLGHPVRRLIRGHDHIGGPARFSLYPNYRQNRIVTINTLSSRLPREFDGAFVRMPCVARGRVGLLPEIHVLSIPAEVVTRIHGDQGGGSG